MEKPVDDRISNIINHLVPTASLMGKLGPTETLQDRLAYYHTPAITIAVVNNFEVEWALAVGVCDIRSKNKVTIDTLFQAGSISKPIFALAVLQLKQTGLLNLDEDINHYLSSWCVPATDGWQPNITLRQLLSHTAGLTVHGLPGYQASEKIPTVSQILNGNIRSNTASVEVNILPGLQFRYSDGGFAVAQQVVVDLLKKPFPQIMHDLLLKPLGLTNSTFAQPLPKTWAIRAATAHPWKNIPIKGKAFAYLEMAAAGLWTTATDLAHIGVELLKVLNDRKPLALLTKNSIESMLQPQLAHQETSDSGFIGLGFHCCGRDDSFRFGHAGRNEGFLADMRFYRNLGKGAVVMINSNEGRPLIDELMVSIGKEYEWPNDLTKAKEQLYLEDISSYLGLYSSTSKIKFNVNVIGGKMTLQYGDQPPLPIYPTSESEFFARAINAVICFERDDNANIVALTLNQEGNRIRADKFAPQSA